MENNNNCSSKGILTRNQKKMLSEKATDKPSNSDKKKIKLKEKQQITVTENSSNEEERVRKYIRNVEHMVEYCMTRNV